MTLVALLVSQNVQYLLNIQNVLTLKKIEHTLNNVKISKKGARFVYEKIKKGNAGRSKVSYKALTDAEPQEAKDKNIETSAQEFEEEETEKQPSVYGKLNSWRGVAVGIGLGVALSIGGMGFINKQPTTKAPAATGAAVAQQATRQTVTVAPVEAKKISRILAATGTVAAREMLPVLPQINGLRIEQVLVDEGDKVEAGQVMAILDNAVLQTQIEQAKAQVEASRSSVKHQTAALAQAQGNLKQARASLAEAEAAVSQALAAKAETEAAVLQAKAAEAEAQAFYQQAEASLRKAKTNQEQAEREWQRYQKLAQEGAISELEAELYRTRAETAREEVRLATANISSAEARIKSARSNISSAEARLQSAKANVSSAEARLQSAKANVSNALAQIEIAKANASGAEAEVRSSKARVEQQQTQLEQTVVRAPKSGIVAERMARVGDVTGGQRLFSIIRDGQLELQAEIPETQLSQVRIGASVQVTSDADARIQLQGNVREIAPLVNREKRQAIVKIDLPKNDLLKPGMFLRAAIITDSVEGLAVPYKAVLSEGERKIVYVLEAEDKVKAQPVEVGEIIEGSGDLNNAKVEIKSGLKVGERVVVAGATYLKDGDRVKVVP